MTAPLIIKAFFSTALKASEKEAVVFSVPSMAESKRSIFFIARSTSASTKILNSSVTCCILYLFFSKRFKNTVKQFYKFNYSTCFVYISLPRRKTEFSITRPNSKTFKKIFCKVIFKIFTA